VQTFININCSVTPGQEVRLCLSMGDPNGESGSTRYLMNGGNKLYYDVFFDPGRTQRWGSWLNGVGMGYELVFTSSTSTYSTSLPIFARVFGGQQMVPTQNPALIYSTTFTRNVTTLYQRAQYTSTGLDCSQLTAGGSAWAGPMTVTASVQHKCIVSGGSLNFGIVSSLSNRIDASTNISLICSNTLPYNIALDNGLNATTSTTRKMKNGANTVDYSLFRDAGRTRNWGATVGVDTLGGVGTAVTTSIPIYGRVPAQNTPPATTYTDTVQITVTY
jgi:spore coat protein U-like protein